MEKSKARTIPGSRSAWSKSSESIHSHISTRALSPAGPYAVVLTRFRVSGENLADQLKDTAVQPYPIV